MSKEKSVVVEFPRPEHMSSDAFTADLSSNMIVLVGPGGRIIAVSPELPEAAINEDTQFLHMVLDAMREKILTLESENRGLKTHAERVGAHNASVAIVRTPQHAGRRPRPFR
jgi:hypothetical protein